MALKFKYKADAAARREEIFTLAEGRVLIAFPSKLSGESIGDLRKYLELFVAKMARELDDPHDNAGPAYTNPLGHVGTGIIIEKDAPTESSQ